MINEDLKQFIKNSLAKGVPVSTIKMQLLSTGWSETDIAEGLASVTPPASAPIAPTSTPAPIGKSPSSFATTTPIIGMGQASSQASFVAQTPAQQDSSATLFGIGIISILVAGAVTFLFKIPFINPLYFVGASLVLSLIQVAILHMWTKIFKVPTASWGRAFFVVGIPGVCAVILSFLTSIPIPVIASVVIALGILIGWFVLFIKIYKVGFGKAFGIGILTIILVGIISIILGFVLGLGAFVNFAKDLNFNNPPNIVNTVVDTNQNPTDYPLQGTSDLLKYTVIAKTAFGQWMLQQGGYSDYTINNISLLNTKAFDNPEPFSPSDTNDAFMVDVDFAVKPVQMSSGEISIWAAGNGVVTDYGWIDGKSLVVTIDKNASGEFYVKNVGTSI